MVLKYMTSNTYILVLNRLLAVITYWTNLVLLLVLATIILQSQVSLPHFREAIHFLVDPYYQVLVYLMIYIHIHKEFCVGGSKAKTVLYCSYIAPQGVNRAILFVYRTGYAYSKEPEGFQKIFLGPFSAG